MKPSERVITFIDSSVNAAKPRHGKRTEYRVQDTRKQMMPGLVLDGVDFHSIRHTVETQLAKVGVDDSLRDRILDHKRRLKQSEGERYNHYDFYRPKYQALAKLEQRMQEIVTGKLSETTIVPLHSRARGQPP